MNQTLSSTQGAVNAASADMAAPPLVVDLDGTLVRSDLLLESWLVYLRRHPLRFPATLAWLARGRAELKRQLAERVDLDVGVLPYEPLVLDLLKAERATGRVIVLATAAHRKYAEAVAEYLGLFDLVMATDRGTNLSGPDKRAALVREFGEQGFDYLGDAHKDLPVWSASRVPYLVNPSFGVERRVMVLGKATRILRTARSGWKEWPKGLRWHQWVKNLLIFVPLLASHNALQAEMLISAILAFLCFTLCASSAYLFNDLLDLEDDRHHPGKRDRPIAAGRIPLRHCLAVSPGLLVLAFTLSMLWLPVAFSICLAGYFGLTLLYSLVLKRVVMVDVLTLALLYTSRIIAGALAAGVPLTFWMLAFSMFLFLSLALVKRHAELHLDRRSGRKGKTRGRGYYPDDLELVSSMGAASGYLSVLVLALYIQDEATLILYSRPEMIWPACLVLLFWISRMWLTTHRGEMRDDPVIFAVKDPVSLAAGLLFGASFWLAT